MSVRGEQIVQGVDGWGVMRSNDPLAPGQVLHDVARMRPFPVEHRRDFEGLRTRVA